jgi:hypothetical protein
VAPLTGYQFSVEPLFGNKGQNAITQQLWMDEGVHYTINSGIIR